MDDRALDALAAERIMGWRKIDIESDRWGAGGLHYSVDGDTHTHRVDRWSPTTNIAQAMELLMRIQRGGGGWFMESSAVGVSVTIYPSEDDPTDGFASAWGAPARAITLAALRAVGVDCD